MIYAVEVVKNLGQTAEQLIEKQIIPANKFEYFLKEMMSFFVNQSPV